MHILFICTGNVSRSAVAECILRTMAERQGRDDITISSAGTHNLYRQPYDPKMIETAARYGYQMQGNSRFMTPEILQQADHIFTMEHYHYVQVQKDLPYAQWYKLHLLNKFCFSEDIDIEDPLYTDTHYEYIFHQIESCCKIILYKI